MADPKKDAESSADWSSLPSDLLHFIGTKIKIHSDYVRFRAVCIPWRSSSPATPTHLPCQPPWILLPPPGVDENDNRRSVIEVVSNKHHHLPLPRLPEARRCHRCCRGSSDGWLVMLEGSQSVVAVNPLTGAELNLPPLSTLPIVAQFDPSNVGWEYSLRRYAHSISPPTCSLRTMRDVYVKKIILSYRRPDDYTALAVLRWPGVLACCKSGEDEWTPVPAGSNISMVEDAAFFQGMVYLLKKSGSIVVCDVSCNSPKVVAMEHMFLGNPCAIDLVSASDELFLVRRFLPENQGLSWARPIEARDFKVYRLSSCGKRLCWERVKDLEGRALFLGNDHCSVALAACDHPGCKPNSIYYSEGDNLAIISLEHGTIERNVGLQSGSPYPLWFTPNPC